MGLGLMVKGPKTSGYEVVLATCNGQEFLDQQLASILRQSVLPERLLVADDGSADQTLNLVEAWQLRSPVPITFLPAAEKRLGCCANFERLLAASSAAYVMPSDQDDIWDSNKAERLLAAMARLEQRWNSDRPLLVHTDLRLIDRVGHPLAGSFHRQQGLDPGRQGWLALGMQNVVTGCACLLNRACVQQALPFPPEAVLHDWWLALVAARLGEVAYLTEPSLSYRQHARNVVGAAGWRRQLLRRLQEALVGVFCGNISELWVGPALRQLQACEQRCAPLEGSSKTFQISLQLDLLWSHSGWCRLRAARDLHLRKHGIWRTLGLYAVLLGGRPKGGPPQEHSYDYLQRE